MKLLQDGGPLFMYTLLFLLVVCLVLIAKGIVKGDVNNHAIKLINHISLFALVWGFLGFMIGMITGLDAISLNKGIATPILASGIKIAMLSPSFGILVFLIARLGIIGLHIKNK